MSTLKDDTHKALDSIFATHESRLKAQAAATEQRKSQEQLFLEIFLQRREGVIRPALEEIGEFAKQRGYDYDIVVEEDSYDPRTYKGRGASIGIRFSRPSDDGRGSYGVQSPNFSVVCDKARDRVWFHKNTMMGAGGGMAGGDGEVKLEDITRDLIHDRLIKIMAEIFR